MYAEFKDKGLEVVGVSIDNSDKAWKKALEEEKLDYLQLGDPKNIIPSSIILTVYLLLSYFSRGNYFR